MQIALHVFWFQIFTLIFLSFLQSSEENTSDQVSYIWFEAI